MPTPPARIPSFSPADNTTRQNVKYSPGAEESNLDSWIVPAGTGNRTQIEGGSHGDSFPTDLERKEGDKEENATSPRATITPSRRIMRSEHEFNHIEQLY